MAAAGGVRPFTLLAASVLARVAALVDSALVAWRQDWGVAAGALSVQCERAWEAELPAATLWRQGRRGEAGAAWLAWPGQFSGALAHALFAPDSEGAALLASAAGLAGDCAEAAFEQLSAALASIVLPGTSQRDNSQPDPADLARGAGAMLLRLRIGKQELCVLLDGACGAALAARCPAPAAPGRAALAPLNYLHALRALPLRLPVQAGSVELGLGSLATVVVGDVIRLDTPIDAAVAVLAPGRQALLQAYLGQADGFIAVELSGRDGAPAQTSL